MPKPPHGYRFNPEFTPERGVGSKITEAINLDELNELIAKHNQALLDREAILEAEKEERASLAWTVGTIAAIAITGAAIKWRKGRN